MAHFSLLLEKVGRTAGALVVRARGQRIARAPASGVER